MGTFKSNIKLFTTTFIGLMLLLFISISNNNSVSALDTKAMSIDNTKVFSTNGVSVEKVSTGSSDYDQFYVYLNEGDSFKYTSTYGGSDYLNSPARTGKTYIIDPDGEYVSVDYPKGVTTATSTYVKDPIDGIKSITIVANQTGVYYVKQVPDAGSDTFNTINFNVENSLGNYQSGRVWADNIYLQSSWKTQTNGSGKLVESDDYTFYHVTSTGYIYKQDLKDFNGIAAVINSDPVGILDTREENCTPVYGDTPFWATTLYTPLKANEQCIDRVQANHIFLESPDTSLPETSELLEINADGSIAKDETGKVIKNEKFVLPVIENKKPETKSISFKRDVYYENSGMFSLDIVNAQGFVELLINIDDDADGINDRTLVREVLVNEFGNTNYYWNGLDDEGNKVSITSLLSAVVSIERAGETHFLLTDVETSGSRSIEKIVALNIENVGDSTVYYNSSTLPIDLDNVKNTSIPNPLEGSYDSKTNPTFRGWNRIESTTNVALNTVVPRLLNYEGMPTDYKVGTNQDPTTNMSSYGDGNLVQEWTYENVKILSSKTRLDPYVPKVLIEKAADKTTALVNDKITYSIKVTNQENFEVVNYTVTDTLNDLTKVNYIIDSISVDNVKMTDVVDEDIVSYQDGQLKVDFLKLNANQEVIITFEVEVQEPAAGTSILNVAMLESTFDKTESNEVVVNVEKPVIEEPVIEEPVTEEPVTEEPVTEEPVTSNDSNVTVENKSVDEGNNLNAVGLLETTQSQNILPKTGQNDLYYVLTLVVSTMSLLVVRKIVK